MGRWLDASCLYGDGGLGLVGCVLSCKVRYGGGEWDFEGGSEDPLRPRWVRNGEQLGLRDGIAPSLGPVSPQARGQWGAGQRSGGLDRSRRAFPLQKQCPMSERDGVNRTILSKGQEQGQPCCQSLIPGRCWAPSRGKGSPPLLHHPCKAAASRAQQRVLCGAPGAAAAPHCPS